MLLTKAAMCQPVSGSSHVALWCQPLPNSGCCLPASPAAALLLPCLTLMPLHRSAFPPSSCTALLLSIDPTLLCVASYDTLLLSIASALLCFKTSVLRHPAFSASFLRRSVSQCSPCIAPLHGITPVLHCTQHRPSVLSIPLLCPDPCCSGLSCTPCIALYRAGPSRSVQLCDAQPVLQCPKLYLAGIDC